MVNFSRVGLAAVLRHVRREGDVIRGEGKVSQYAGQEGEAQSQGEAAGGGEEISVLAEETRA